MTQLQTVSETPSIAAKTLSLGPWSLCAQAPNAIAKPSQLNDTVARWLPAVVPGTVASALEANGQWKLGQPLDVDAFDWCYRTTFAAPDTDEPTVLAFDGLATLAEVWLNDELVLSTDNMFRSYRLNITPHLKPHNELMIIFRSLTADLGTKRPRPRWKTNLVQHQQLRWRRTSLLGRIPGWSPPVAPAGPWRAIHVETGPILLSDVSIVASLKESTGVVTFDAHIDPSLPIENAHFRVGHRVSTAQLNAQRDALHAEVHVPKAPLWWPHTHGEQPLLDAALIINDHVIPCGKVGFRRLEANQDNGLSLSINGVPIFCRGACWTVADIAALDGDPATLEHDLRLARDAGVNMLRVGGTMVYESDAFYRLCDELGILVWQDFMFANMDYPVDDPAFAANIEAEATYQLRRLARHPSVAVYCGNSEVEQQAAMLGMPRELWRNRFFAERLPALQEQYHPGACYVPSTPSGGVLPFHTASGLTHFYGVGAYLRSPREVRQADVKFTPECLGFANVPEPSTIDEVTGGALPAIHHPKWKERVPRDSGAGWDFDDVRDHYLKQFFGVDPAKLRSFDMPRYLQLGRVVTGEMMAQTFGEWRSGHSHCHGALVWFYKDLWPGAGWGILDSLGQPKAAYYYLRRAWASRQITLTDEGLDGLHLHIINETAQPLRGAVEVLLLKDAHIVAARQSVPCEIGPRDRRTLSADEILGAFYDVTYAYRFGPPKHDVVIATLFDHENKPISEACHFVQPREPDYLSDLKLDVKTNFDGRFGFLTLTSERFLQSVGLNAAGFLPDDNYFHLSPGREKVVRFQPWRAPAAKFQGYIEALNLQAPVKFAAK
jgi:beta-mannosidase